MDLDPQFAEYLRRDSDKRKILEALKVVESLSDPLPQESAKAAAKQTANLAVRRGIYVYGQPGVGKTVFVEQLLQTAGYDIVRFDTSGNRNRALVESISSTHQTNRSVLDMFSTHQKRVVIVMDEVESIGGTDKCIKALMNLARPKRTKKQQTEDTTINPVIFIGNYHTDKQIVDLMKVCVLVELLPPPKELVEGLLGRMMPLVPAVQRSAIVESAAGDLRKLKTAMLLYERCGGKMVGSMHEKMHSDNPRLIVRGLFRKLYPVSEHETVMNETDYKSVGLIWHENVLDLLPRTAGPGTVALYSQMLENFCLADYIDRITFQTQIWKLHEMSSIIKTFKNNALYHRSVTKKRAIPVDLRFTKVLTNYSTEYNNYKFIARLCNALTMDRTDLFALFIEVRSDPVRLAEIVDQHELSAPDVDRMYKFLDKYSAPSFTDVRATEDCEDSDDGQDD